MARTAPWLVWTWSTCANPGELVRPGPIGDPSSVSRTEPKLYLGRFLAINYQINTFAMQSEESVEHAWPSCNLWFFFWPEGYHDSMILENHSQILSFVPSFDCRSQPSSWSTSQEDSHRELESADSAGTAMRRNDNQLDSFSPLPFAIRFPYLNSRYLLICNGQFTSP